MHDLISHAHDVWLKTQILTKTPSWEREPKEAYLVEVLVKEQPLVEEYLWKLIFDTKNLVSAYAIHTLYRRRSIRLADLPSELRNRSGHITIQIGSFRSKQQYKDYVAEMVRFGKAFRQSST